MNEILNCLKTPQQWWTLAMFDIKQRYRRSTLGPLWVTLSTGITIATLGVLWSTLFKSDIKDFMPFFAAGFVIWIFMSAQLGEGCSIYTQYEGYIKQINLPLPFYVLRVWARNLILFGHNFLVFLVVWACFGFGWLPDFPTAVAGFLIVSLVFLFLSIPIAIVCTRFRDISPIVQSLIQITYFFTPVMWQTKSLPKDYMWLVDYNPLHHLFEIVRAPLLGQAVQPVSWVWAIGALAFAVILASVLHQRYRKHIAYWL